MRGARFLFLALVLSVPPAAAQPLEPQSPDDLSILEFLQAVETAISTMDRQRWSDLISANATRDPALAFFDQIPDGVTRVVVKERARGPLPDAPPGESYLLVTELFIETGARGRIVTWGLEIQRLPVDGQERQPWRIMAQERLSSVEGLHRLELDQDRQFTASNLVLRSVDFEVRLPSGQVFVAETTEGVTALVLMGNGSIFFAPTPKEERGQLRLFARTEELDAAFTTAFVRVSPFEFASLVDTDALVVADAVDGRSFRRAQQVFDDEISKSFSLDLSDLSRETWSLLPQPGDFVAEVKTRRYDRLTFARSTGEAEDVTLFQRDRKRNIALYASEQKLASRGRYYNEDDLVDIDILDYAVNSTFTPEREWLEGQTRLKLRVASFALPAITLKLAEALTVNSVVSDEFGRLLFLRIRNQNAIIINLPTPVPRGDSITLHISYQGRMVRQGVNDNSMTVAADQQGDGGSNASAQVGDLPLVRPEPNWLFSNRSQWYPQAPVTDYAMASVRIAVPPEYTVVASGVEATGSPVILDADDNGQGGQAVFVFTAGQPVRYLSMLVSRMTRADTVTVTVDVVPPDEPPVAPNGDGVPVLVPPVGSRNTLALTIYANRRQEDSGRQALSTIADIVQLYASTVGDVPYDALNVAMVEDNLPGGHAPGYMAIINNPPPTTPHTWRNDPAAFSDFPDFFLAHELAHQWFGQAVGWKNYHEQWLSEGFAQYMAALFARQQRGEDVFRNILKQFRRWGIQESDQGPVYLGYRLGHIKGESKVFRALVYNKGASILHMLRRFVGDEAFFKGVRRYYRDNRFKKAGTTDLQKAMEAESGLDLTRFFERWVFDSGIPRLRYSTALGPDEVTVRIEQTGELFDVPVTVSIQYRDGTVTEEVVRVTEGVTEARISVKGDIRSVELNQDHAALAHFDRSR